MKGNADLQQRIEKTLQQMEADVFAPSLGTHKLSGKLEGLQSCSCGYDCRVVFSMMKFIKFLIKKAIAP